MARALHELANAAMAQQAERLTAAVAAAAAEAAVSLEGTEVTRLIHELQVVDCAAEGGWSRVCALVNALQRATDDSAVSE
jgi:hypothetical protein